MQASYLAAKSSHSGTPIFSPRLPASVEDAREFVWLESRFSTETFLSHAIDISTAKAGSTKSSSPLFRRDTCVLILSQFSREGRGALCEPDLHYETAVAD